MLIPDGPSNENRPHHVIIGNAAATEVQVLPLPLSLEMIFCCAVLWQKRSIQVPPDHLRTI